MRGHEHRNVQKKHFCPACDHYHHLPNSNVPNATGVCLKEPPKAFVIGLVAAQPVIARDDAPPTQIPVVRSFYPPVGPSETCAQWTPRAEGEA